MTPSENESKPDSLKPLILLHGALGTRRDLRPVEEALSGEYDMYRFDFTGHGENRPGADFRIPGLVHQLRQFIKDQDLRDCRIFGYSMGGYVALSLALEEPELMRSITTLGTKFDWSPESVAQETGKLNPDIIEEKVPAFARALAQQHGEEHWKQVLHSTAQMMKELSKDPLLTPGKVSSIKLPVQLLLGDQDRMVSESETRSMQQALPNSRFSLLRESAHPLPKVNTGELAARLRDPESSN